MAKKKRRRRQVPSASDRAIPLWIRVLKIRLARLKQKLR